MPAGFVPEPNTGCWLDLGGLDGAGYPNGRHRRALEKKLGRPIAPGMRALHSCDVPSCVNPDHLREGTQSENLLDASNRGRHNYASRTHCKNGHPFAGRNLAVRQLDGRSWRVCRRCQADATARCKVRRMEGSR